MGRRSRSSYRVPLVLSVLPLLLASLTACFGIEDAVDKAASSVEKAISAILADSTAWREKLTDLSEDLVSQASDAGAKVVTTASNQVAAMARETVALTDDAIENRIGQAGVEFRCNADFARQSVTDALTTIVENLKFWEENEEERNATPPHGTCWVTPSVLSLSPSGDHWSVDDSTMIDKGVVHVYGYNYRSDALPQLQLQNIRGDVVREAFVKPAYVSRYQVDLDLAAETFEDVAPGSRLVMVWPDVDDPSTVTLTMRDAAKLTIESYAVDPPVPVAGKDPVTLTVSLINNGGTRSGHFVVTWKPDPNDGHVSSATPDDPLGPGQTDTLRIVAPPYVRDGVLMSTVSLSNGDDAVTFPVQVAPAPHIPLPEKRVDGFPVPEKLIVITSGKARDIRYGGPCEPGYVRSRVEIIIIDRGDTDNAWFKDWVGPDPTQCEATVHYSLATWLEVRVYIYQKGI